MGLLNDILMDGIDKAVQMTGQGAAEMAAALFSQSDALVQYGAGQNPIEPNQSAEQAVEAPVVEQAAAPVVEQPAIQEQSRGMEM